MAATRKVYTVKRYRRHGGYAVLAFIIEKKFLLISIAAAVVVIILFFAPGILTNYGEADDASAQYSMPAVETEPSVSPSVTSTVTATPEPSVSASAVVFSRVLKYTKPNMQGDDVWALQEKLGLEPDGFFGPSTAAAVVKFQLKNGLTGDGIVGDETLQKLGLK